VAIHDSWFVPLVVYYPAGRAVAVGEKVLQSAIADAGQEWLEGLGDVYGWFADQTLGTPHRKLARGVRQCWRRRVSAGRWPIFTTG